MNKSKEVYHNKDWLTSFGACYGFAIANDCNINTKSNSYLETNGYYELPQGIKAESNEADSYLAGSYKFKVLEMEVFKLEWKK